MAVAVVAAVRALACFFQAYFPSLGNELKHQEASYCLTPNQAILKIAFYDSTNTSCAISISCLGRSIHNLASSSIASSHFSKRRCS
jgi:hypothetical protein